MATQGSEFTAPTISVCSVLSVANSPFFPRQVSWCLCALVVHSAFDFDSASRWNFWNECESAGTTPW